MKIWQYSLVKNIGPEQFAALFKTTPASVIGIVVNSSIMAVALIDRAPAYEILVWWIINMLTAAYAFYRWAKNRNRNPSKISRRAIKKLTLTAFVFALPWVYVIVAYLGNLSQGREIILVTVVGGMAASGGIQLSRIYPAAMVYMTCLLLTGAVKSLYVNQTDYFLLAVLFVSYGVFLEQVIRAGAIQSLERSTALHQLHTKVREMDIAKKSLQRIAMEDPLTSLPNRREFHQRLAATVSEARRQGSTAAILLCDLDHFKNINDISGHAAGDALLVELADRLQNCVRQEDIVARIGGDEFAIITKHHRSPKDTVDFAQRILEAVNQPVSIEGTNVQPGISIGISMFPYDAQDEATLLSHADLALQRGKAAGRGQYYFFDQKMKSQLSCDTAMETDLRLALVDEELELFYQPKVCIRTGMLQGFEALVRWRRADGSVVTPGEFFNVAEERGLISYISDFVMEQALADICYWRENNYNPGTISINIHPTQLKDLHRMRRFMRDVERHKIDPGCIYLEITENCIIGRGTEEVPQILEEFCKKGFKISLDDFGTGFASLTHLKNLPVDELKFDRSFIHDLLSNASNRAIVHAMIKLASSLDMKTVAEGVENREQHNVLMAMGCTTGQGYLYNKPLIRADATRMIASAGQVQATAITPAETQISPKISLARKTARRSA